MKSSKIHRVAVVGCGALAQDMHLPNCLNNARIQLVAVCDRIPETAAFCKNQFGAERAETDWQRIVESDDIDVCILATHTNLRGDFILPALANGKAVYTEKPLAPSRAEMNAIVQCVRRTGRPVCVGHNRRSSPAVLEFKRLIQQASECSGSLSPSVDRSEGRPPLPEELTLQLLIRVNDDARSWKEWVFWDAEGILFAEMVHFIDLALWLNPGIPVRAFAEGSPRGNFTLLLRFHDGSLTTLQHTMVGHFDYPKELFEATTRNVTIAMEHHVELRQCGLSNEPLRQTFPLRPSCDWPLGQGIQGYFEDLSEELERARDTGRPPRSLTPDKGHARHLDRFLDHLEGHGDNPCPVESAVPVNRIAMKLLESARLGLPVSIGPEDWHLPGAFRKKF